MRFYVTDFHPWEKVLIEQHRKEGRFVYTMHDAGKDGYYLTSGGMVNRIGYMITDTAITELPMFEDTFEKVYHPVEDVSLSFVAKDLTSKLKRAKEAYEEEQLSRMGRIANLMERQRQEQELENRYRAFRRSGRKIPVYEGNLALYLQGISLSDTEDGHMKVRYFIENTITGKIVRDSSEIETLRGAPSVLWMAAIERKEKLVGRRYVCREV